MAVVVSDTSPIRALHHLKLDGLLADLFGEVLIPPAVAAELSNPASGLATIDSKNLRGVRVIEPTDQARVVELELTLDPGESQALALALELRADAVLMDEHDGRATARRLGLVAIGVIGVLARAKRKGFVTELAPLLQRLRREINFFISDELIREVLRDAGE